MHLPPNELYAGLVTNRALRDYLSKRFYRNEYVALNSMTAELGLSADDAATLLNVFLEQGLVEQTRDHVGDDRDLYDLLPPAMRIANSKFTKRIQRAKAEQMVKALIERAEAIYANDELTHVMAEVHVFGSYLTDAPDLGDLDVAYEMEPRNSDRDVVKWSFERAKKSGKQNLSFMASLGFGEHEVMKLLKGTDSRVAIHDLREIKRLGIETKVLFNRHDKSHTPAYLAKADAEGDDE